MIQVIGLMIGSYIIVRMVSFIQREGPYQESKTVRVLCTLNILFNIFLIIALLSSGSSLGGLK